MQSLNISFPHTKKSYRSIILIICPNKVILQHLHGTQRYFLMQLCWQPNNMRLLSYNSNRLVFNFFTYSEKKRKMNFILILVSHHSCCFFIICFIILSAFIHLDVCIQRNLLSVHTFMNCMAFWQGHRSPFKILSEISHRLFFCQKLCQSSRHSSLDQSSSAQGLIWKR